MQRSGEETQVMVGPIFTFSDKWHLYHPRTLYKRVRPCKLSFLILRLNTMHIQRTPAKQPQTLHMEDKGLSTKVLVSHVSPPPPVNASTCFFNWWYIIWNELHVKSHLLYCYIAFKQNVTCASVSHPEPSLSCSASSCWPSPWPGSAGASAGSERRLLSRLFLFAGEALPLACLGVSGGLALSASNVCCKFSRFSSIQISTPLICHKTRIGLRGWTGHADLWTQGFEWWLTCQLNRHPLPEHVWPF